MIRHVLTHRREHERVDAPAGYEPLTVHGPRAADAVAFRCRELVVVVPRRGDGAWDGTFVDVPGHEHYDVLTERSISGGAQPLAELFADFPVAVLATARA
jgi:maltooligosyltrehalose synthase